MAAHELGWAILELMGHIRLGGFITEEERFGTKIGRIDIHGPDGAITTQFFGGSSVYRITPTTEAIAKAIGARSAAPIQRWELPALEAPRETPVVPGEPPTCEICDAPVNREGDICALCREDDPDGSREAWDDDNDDDEACE